MTRVLEEFELNRTSFSQSAPGDEGGVRGMEGKRERREGEKKEREGERVGEERGR